MTIRKTYYLIFVIASANSIIGCTNHEDQSNHHGIMETIKNQEQDSIAQMNIEGLMEDMKKVLADVSDSARDFYVLERQSMLTSYPCSNCHNVPLDQLQSQPESEKKAHWNIDLVHAGLDVMNCNTCHDKNDLNQLTLIEGSAITFDHSYKQCEQCHSTQYKDWLGGAHGKRVKGWGQPKVVNSCANCHNPHQPAILSRWPARLNTQKIKERDGE